MYLKGITILTWATIFFFARHTSAQEGYDLKFQIDNIPDSVVYLGYHFGDQRYLKDTATVTNGNTLIYKGDERLTPGIYFLYAPKYYFEFIVKEQQFTLKTSREGGYSTLAVDGSRENEIFKEFQLGMVAIQQQKKKLIDSLATASNKQDSTALYEAIANTDIQATDFRSSLVEKYPDTFVSELVYLMERPVVPEFDSISDNLELQKAKYLYYKDNFFKNINLANEGLLRTPILFKTVNEYLDEVIIQHPDSINKALDLVLGQVKENEESYRFWLVKLFTKYQESTIMGMDAVVVHLIENYYLNGQVPWLDQESIDKLADEVKFIKPNLLGKAAPKLQLLDTAMKPMDLKQINADYTVLYFYDPDCGHCKKKTPVLLEAYRNELKQEGVEVLAVCTVTDVDKWKKYIRNNELNWLNGADPNYRSNFRMEYNVRSTPTVYVLDKDKKIIAKKLDVEQLADFIEQYKKRNETND